MMRMRMVSVIGRIPSLSRFFSISVCKLFSTSCDVSTDGKKLKLACDDDPERRYHGVWLRHNCRCSVCLPLSSQQNIVHHSNLVDLKITNATIKGDSVLVNWQSQAGSHSCSFDIDWLKKHDYTTPSVHKQRIQEEIPLIAKSLPTSDYQEVMSSLDGYYEWMKQINYYGMTLLQNIPKESMVLLKMTDQISPPIPHLYETIYNVRAKENASDASDASYTTDDLLLHSDQNVYESSPGIQILFSLQFDECVEGGESIIVDTYPVLQELRQKHPKQFEVLTRVPYITHRQHNNLESLDISVGFKYSSPHIGLNSNGQINLISWSPQFHYPLAASEQDTEDYYEAFTLLSAMFEESPLKFTQRLKPGESLVLNNRRVLHSRNSFKLNGGERCIQGHYINIDFFLSRIRTLARHLNKNEPIKTMFNRSHTV